MQTVPGKESDICRLLQRELSEKEISQNYDSPEQIVFYDALSDFDLIAFPRFEFSEETFNKLNIADKHLLDFQKLIYYILERQNGMNATKFVYGSALTLTMIKIDTKKVRQPGGIEFDLSLIEQINKLLDEFIKDKENISRMILSTFGIPEFVLIMSGKDLARLLSILRLLNYSYHQNGHGSIAYYHTISCIKRTNTYDDKRKTFHYEKNDEVDGLGVWRIGISCFSGNPLVIVESVQDYSRTLPIPSNSPLFKVSYTYGKRDMIVTPEDDRVRDYNHLINLIKHISNFALEKGLELETKTIISTPGNELDEFQNKQIVLVNHKLENHDELNQIVPIQIKINNWRNQAQELLKLEKEIESPILNISCQVINLLIRYLAALNSPGIFELVIDMEPMLGFIMKYVGEVLSLLPTYNHKPLIAISNNIRNRYNLIEQSILIFNFALDKRISGVELGIGSKVTSDIAALGIHRILTAVQFLPRIIFSRYFSRESRPDFWKGFIIFGYSPFLLCMQNSVINIPYRDLYHPSDWSSLGHEIGHAFTVASDAKRFPFVVSMIKELDTHNINNYIASDGDDFVEEILASYFEYLFIFRGDYQEYLKTTWRTIDALAGGLSNVPQLSGYILRAVCILFFHLENIGFLLPQDNVKELFRQEEQKVLDDANIKIIVQNRTLRGCGMFEEILKKDIIDPIKKTTKWIQTEISLVDFEKLKAIYFIIDPYRHELINFFNELSNSKLGNQNNENFDKFKRRLLISGLDRKSIDKIKKGLSKKMILSFDDPLDAIHVPLALSEMTKEERDFSVQISGILTLWDAACRSNFKEKRDSSQ